MERQMSAQNKFEQVHRLMREGQHHKALALMIDPSTGELRSRFGSDPNLSWYAVGDALYKLGDFYAASEAFDEAFKADRNDVDALIALANCYDALNRPESAERVLSRALTLTPKSSTESAIVSFNLANALIDQEKWSQARQILSTLVKRDDEVGIKARRNLTYLDAVAK
jgi:tetratricopeptide (TPR) repeat protein